MANTERCLPKDELQCEVDKNININICTVCKQEFIPCVRHPDQKLCSYPCKLKHKAALKRIYRAAGAISTSKSYISPEKKIDIEEGRRARKKRALAKIRNKIPTLWKRNQWASSRRPYYWANLLRTLRRT